MLTLVEDAADDWFWRTFLSVDPGCPSLLSLLLLCSDSWCSACGASSCHEAALRAGKLPNLPPTRGLFVFPSFFTFYGSEDVR